MGSLAQGRRRRMDLEPIFRWVARLGGELATEPPTARGTRLAILILLTVALPPRLWTMATMVTPARDAARYVRAAKMLEQTSFSTALQRLPVHPLYPIALLGAQRVERSIDGNDGPSTWIRAGMRLSLACNLGFLMVGYLVARRLWDPLSALIGVAGLSLLPRQVSYACDLISDNLTALLFVLMLWCCLRCWECRHWVWGSLAGICAALGFLSHLEMLIAPAVVIGAWGLSAVVGRLRLRGEDPTQTALSRSLLRSTIAFSLTWIALISGYAVLNGGRLTPRLAGQTLLGVSAQPSETSAQPANVADAAPTSATYLSPHAGTPTVANSSRPATKAEFPQSPIEYSREQLLPRPDQGMEGYERLPIRETLLRVAVEIVNECKPLFLLLLAVSALRWPRTAPRWPEGCLALIAVGATAAMLALLQWKAGYVAGRYAMFVMPLWATFAAKSLEPIAQWATRGRRLPWERSWAAATWRTRRRAAFTLGLTGWWLAICLPATWAPLHGNHAAYRRAADWLRNHAAEGDQLVDATELTSLLSGLPTWTPTEPLPAVLPARFVVVDPRYVYRTESAVYGVIDRAASEGRLVATFPRGTKLDDIGAVIYLLPADSSAREPATGVPR